MVCRRLALLPRADRVFYIHSARKQGGEKLQFIRGKIGQKRGLCKYLGKINSRRAHAGILAARDLSHCVLPDLHI
jgi:hypothetical protein